MPLSKNLRLPAIMGSLSFCYGHIPAVAATEVNCSKANHGLFFGLFGEKSCIDGDIQINANLLEIKDFAFDHAKLTNVDFSKSDQLVSIGEWAFAHNELDHILLPTSITTLSASSFSNNKIKSIKTIGSTSTYNAFEHVVRIEAFAFHGNELTELYMNDEVNYIGHRSFSDNKLSALKISKSIITIERQAFMFNSLVDVAIPDGVKVIGNGAFAHNKLTSVLFSNITLIDDFAFYNNSLIDVRIPASVTAIGVHAFSLNRNLKSICYEGFREPKVNRKKFGCKAPTCVWKKCENSIIAEDFSHASIYDEGNTELILATLEGNGQSVIDLLESGADPNVANRDGETALMVAFFKGHKEIARALFKCTNEDNIKQAKVFAKKFEISDDIRNLFDELGEEL